MNKQTRQWVEGLPRRWTVSGLVIGMIWSGIGVVTNRGLSDVIGGPFAGLLRLLVACVIPFGILGFIWGASEKNALTRWFASGADRFQQAIRRSVLRHVGKGMNCGILYGVYVHWLGIGRSFRPWDSEGNITANITAVVSFALLAMPVGAIVGLFVRRKLRTSAMASHD